MNRRDEIEAIVRTVYEARVRGDIDTVMKHFAPDAHFSLVGSASASPVPMTCTGHGAIRETMRRLCESFEFIRADMLSLVVEGDRATIHSEVHIRVPATSREAVTEFADMVRFEGNKIASFKQFADTALATQLIAG